MGAYLDDFGTAGAETAGGLGLWSQVESRLMELAGVLLWKLHLVGEVVQDAHTVLCGLWEERSGSVQGTMILRSNILQMSFAKKIYWRTELVHDVLSIFNTKRRDKLF